MELISTLLGVSFASGLNVYATVLAMGLLNRRGFVHLSPSLDVISTTPILVVAAILYAVEFFVDKVPVLDSMRDALHTVIRPAAGALLAFGAVGHVDSKWQILAALLGGSLALTSHAAKASSRVAAQVSPELFTNWILSLTEDGIAVCSRLAGRFSSFDWARGGLSAGGRGNHHYLEGFSASYVDFSAVRRRDARLSFVRRTI